MNVNSYFNISKGELENRKKTRLRHAGGGSRSRDLFKVMGFYVRGVLARGFRQALHSHVFPAQTPYHGRGGCIRLHRFPP